MSSRDLTRHHRSALRGKNTRVRTHTIFLWWRRFDLNRNITPSTVSLRPLSWGWHRCHTPQSLRSTAAQDHYMHKLPYRHNKRILTVLINYSLVYTSMKNYRSAVPTSLSSAGLPPQKYISLWLYIKCRSTRHGVTFYHCLTPIQSGKAEVLFSLQVFDHVISELSHQPWKRQNL